MRLFYGLLLLCMGWAASTEAGCPALRRSAAVRRAFQQQHPCPSTEQRAGPCPGFIADHVIPLCLGPEAGGRDVVDNLQWQSIRDATSKDRIERQQCRAKPRPCPHQGD